MNNVNHKSTNICITAERQFLKVLEGDCETAVGAIANLENKNINLSLELGEEVGEILKKKSNNLYKR